jgi:hypothetical protein
LAIIGNEFDKPVENEDYHVTPADAQSAAGNWGYGGGSHATNGKHDLSTLKFSFPWESQSLSVAPRKAQTAASHISDACFGDGAGSCALQDAIVHSK